MHARGALPASRAGNGQIGGESLVLGARGVKDGQKQLPTGLRSQRGYENGVLWLKRFPRGAIEAIFWGYGVGEFQNRPTSTIAPVRPRALRRGEGLVPSSDDATQVDQPVEIGSVI